MSDEIIEAFGRKWKLVWREGPRTWVPESEKHESIETAWKRLFGETYPGIEKATNASGVGTLDPMWVLDGRLVVSDSDTFCIYVYVSALMLPVSVHPPSDPGTGGVFIPGPVSFTGSLPAVITYEPPADPYTAMVRVFHQRMGLVVRDTPSLGTPAEREERVRLMLEELLELAKALNVAVGYTSEGKLMVEEVSCFDPDIEPDPAEVLHELADLQVTVSGTAVQFGLPLLAATREVHAANMRKTPQGPGRKPLKSDGWKPADVSKVLSGSEWGEPCYRCPTACSEECAGLPTSEAEYRAATIQEAPGAVLRREIPAEALDLLSGVDPNRPASDVLRQLAGSDQGQPPGCDRAECRPFAVEPCACPCACHEVTP